MSGQQPQQKGGAGVGGSARNGMGMGGGTSAFHNPYPPAGSGMGAVNPMARSGMGMGTPMSQNPMAGMQQNTMQHTGMPGGQIMPGMTGGTWGTAQPFPLGNPATGGGTGPQGTYTFEDQRRDRESAMGMGAGWVPPEVTYNAGARTDPSVFKNMIDQFYAQRSQALGPRNNIMQNANRKQLPGQPPMMY